MDTGDLIALGIDLGILFYKFYQLGRMDIKLEETDMTVESMKAFNEAMHIEQKEVEEFFGVCRSIGTTRESLLGLVSMYLPS